MFILFLILNFSHVVARSLNWSWRLHLYSWDWEASHFTLSLEIKYIFVQGFSVQHCCPQEVLHHTSDGPHEYIQTCVSFVKHWCQSASNTTTRRQYNPFSWGYEFIVVLPEWSWRGKLYFHYIHDSTVSRDEYYAHSSLLSRMYRELYNDRTMFHLLPAMICKI